jgi:hypothetical protein
MNRKTQQKAVESFTGYYLPNWFGVVIPEATTNLISNPSVEKITAGYTAVGVGVTLARTLNQQRRGAWSIEIAPAVGVVSGVYYDAAADLVAGEPYTFSLDVLGIAGRTYSIYFASAAGAAIGSVKTFIATGHWQRVSLTYIETATLPRRFYLTQEASDTQLFYTDGWQLENKSYDTTYCDGDLEGFVVGETAYRWSGLVHASISTRSETTRSGGRILNLSDYGFNLTGFSGAGLNTMKNFSIDSNLGGGFYQNTLESDRSLTLVGDISAVSYRQLSYMKSLLEEAFVYDATAYKQPLLLHYQETENDIPVGESIFIECVYDSGLEGVTDNLNTEPLSIRFKMYNPKGITSEGDKAINIKWKESFSVGDCIKLNPSGEWEIISTTINIGSRVVVVLQAGDGSIYIGGKFDNLDGTVVSNIARYQNGILDDLNGGTDALKEVRCLLEGPDGKIYAGGSFTTMGGVAIEMIAVYDPVAGTWADLGNGGLSYMVEDMTFIANGDLVVVGSFTQTADTTIPLAHIATWTPSTGVWAAIGAGTNDENYKVINIPGTNVVYVAGYFTTAGGVACSRICKLEVTTPTYSPLGVGLTYPFPFRWIDSLTLDGNQNLYVRGVTQTIGGITTRGAIWNGSKWTNFPTANNIGVDQGRLAYNPKTGDLFYYDNPAGIVQQMSFWRKNGTNKQYFGIFGEDFVKATSFNDGTIVIHGTSNYWAVGMVKNVIPSRSTKYKYYLKNITGRIALNLLRSHSTNTSASANYFLQPGEIVTVDLDNFSLKSNYLGKISNQFLSGSQVSLPEAGSKDLSVLAIDYTTDHGVSVAQVWKLLIDNITIYNTDNGILYANVVDDGAGFFHIEFYSDAARTVPVGHTTSEIPDTDTNLTQHIIPDGPYGLEGYVWMCLTTAAVDLYFEMCIAESYLQYKDYYPSIYSARYQ